MFRRAGQVRPDSPALHLGVEPFGYTKSGQTTVSDLPNDVPRSVSGIPRRPALECRKVGV